MILTFFTNMDLANQPGTLIFCFSFLGVGVWKILQSIKNKLCEGVYGGKSAMKSTMMSKISVECHSCGASMTVDMNDMKKTCEYCGASLADEISKARYHLDK